VRVLTATLATSVTTLSTTTVTTATTSVTRVVAGSSVTTTSGLSVGHVDLLVSDIQGYVANVTYSDTSTVELLLVHLLDGGISLGLLTVGLLSVNATT